MLWAVPAKSPVAPRALAVLAFFLLLTLYLTWPLPLRMGSGLSTNPDGIVKLTLSERTYRVELISFALIGRHRLPPARR